MAHMIPDDVSIYEFHGSYGEKNIYSALEKLPSEYIVFHSVHWHKKTSQGSVKWGESDFTIFHPKRGLLVIEVKSGGIEHLEGKWTQINSITQERYRMKDPMIQAERSKFTFADLLAPTDDTLHPYWVEAAVWFPSVNAIANPDLPPAYSSGNVLFEKDLSNPQKSIERVYEYYGMHERPYYSQLDMDFVIKTLSPKFDAIPSLATNLEEQSYMFNRMTQEQSYLLDYLDEQNNAAIQGGAGTGKTMLAIEKAKRLSSTDKVLFLCFNKLLLDFLKNTYSETLCNVDFYNLPALVCKQRNVSDCGGNLGISDYLNSFDNYPWTYKHIIIDEGQDFFEEHITLLSAIAELNGGCFYVFYDKNQLVQQRHALEWVKTIECRLVLSANCRNTKSIATTSNRPIGIDEVKMRVDIPGGKPTFHITNSKDQLCERIDRIIRNYTDNGLMKKQIVLLTAKTEEASILYGVSSIGSYHLSRDIAESGILFTSARKFKGLESDVIIMVDVNEETFSSDEARRVFYVGTSRAKHYLEIVALLDDAGIGLLSEKLTGQKSKNAKMQIGSYLKVKIST